MSEAYLSLPPKEQALILGKLSKNKDIKRDALLLEKDILRFLYSLKFKSYPGSARRLLIMIYNNMSVNWRPQHRGGDEQSSSSHIPPPSAGCFQKPESSENEFRLGRDKGHIVRSRTAIQSRR